ncbi:MAG: hypothetical protein GX567_06725 [Clostridia bacterium]|mgnify:CR=1 FL=1|nr:hypothetical protein [Clostridia bacterium]
MKKKKADIYTLIILLIFSTIIAYPLISGRFDRKKPVPRPDYCKEVSKQISDLDLEGFKYVEAEDERKKGVYFSFKSEDNYKPLYDDDDCLDDIIKIKNVISAYLSSHKNEILHEKTIRIGFYGEIGNVIQMYNYEKSGDPPEEVFSYYDDMYIPPDYFDEFKEAKRIGIKITDDDDLAGLANFTNLKELKIFGENEISQKTIEKVVELLPDCEVTYRSKKYKKTTSSEHKRPELVLSLFIHQSCNSDRVKVASRSDLNSS